MIYVYQSRQWWGFNDREFREWFSKALNEVRTGVGYTLPDNHRLTQKPKSVARAMSHLGVAYQPKNNYTRVLGLLNWDRDDWEREAKALGVINS
jgi:hypothetical protein